MGVAADEFVGRISRNLTGIPKGRAVELIVKAIHEPFVGEKLGGNMVQARLGQGSMSVVYKGIQQFTERVVAIKMLRAPLCLEPANVKRFQREAKALSLLNHPNLLTVFEVGTTSTGQPYFTMDFLEGRSLAEVIQFEGALEWQAVVSIFTQVCDALDHAHSKGIIHRDLKPENIMLINSPDGKHVVKVVDFGIVKLSDESQLMSQKLTKTGEVWGSPSYMSPEQCSGAKLDARTDIYSLGTIMYECLTAKQAFDGKRVADIVVKQMSEKPKAPSVVRPDLKISPVLEEIVAKALQKDPGHRFQNMKELKNALEKVTTAASTEDVECTRISRQITKEDGVKPGHQDRIDSGKIEERRIDTHGGATGEKESGSDEDPHIGTKLANRFTVLSKLGEGGMCTVYRAKQDAVDRYVAIKMLHMELCFDELNVKRFEREARAICKLSHPHLITVHDVGIADTGQPFYVMEYLQGYALAELIAAERFLSPERALPIFIQVCDAIGHAHMHGVVHRDLKPENIMLVVTKEREDYVKIVDFGIVKAMDDQQASQRLTKTGEVWGSPVYMSPEQCMGETLEAASDVYSLGAVMYETLTGKPIFEDRNVSTIISKQVTDMPKPFNSARQELKVPSSIESIVFQCLQKDKKKRFQSMAELKQALLKVLREFKGGSGSAPQERKVTPAAPVATYQGASDNKKTMLLVVVFAVFLAASASAGAWFLYQTFFRPITQAGQTGGTSSKVPGAHPIQENAAVTGSDHPGTNADGQHMHKSHSASSTGKTKADPFAAVDVLDPSQRPRRRYNDQYKYYDEVPLDKSGSQEN